MNSIDKTALVTGAGSGIGKAVALALLREGYRVVLTGRRLDLLEDAASAWNTDRALAIACDITQPEAVNALFFQTQQAFGRLDLLFNNAGINAPRVAFEDLAFSDWQRVVDTNLNGAFLCAQAAFKMMKSQTPQGGRIINNGSIAAHAPRPDSAPYCATKHAITGLSKSIQLDGRKYSIACGQIDIGNAMTELAARMATGVPQADGRIAIEPMMDVKEVAAAVVHMAGLPLSTNVPFMTIMATNMPYVGRG